MSNQIPEFFHWPSSNDNEKTSWLDLPGRNYLTTALCPRVPASDYTVRQYCGIDKDARYVFVDFAWTQHWFPEYLLEAPGFAGGLSRRGERRVAFAGRESDLHCLEKHGFNASDAIGFPLCYTSGRNTTRRPNSLLLLPGNLFGGMSCQSLIADYLSEVRSFRKHFTDVVACLRPEFVRYSDWVDKLNEEGIPFVSGFDQRDSNSWQRARDLYSQFEYVTSNELNAELVYATAFGAKSSVFGPSENITLHDVEDVEMFSERPGLAEEVIPLLQKDVIRKHLDFLYVNPTNAVQRTSWGLSEIGWKHRKSKDELLRLMFRKQPQGLSRRIRARLSSTATAIGQRLQQQEPSLHDTLHGRLNANDCEELRRLRLSPPNQPGSAVMDGEKFYFADARTFAWEYTQIYLKQCYDFPSIYRSPTIIDGGANIGIAVRYWLKRFPMARIIAFEPDSRLFSILEKNVAGRPAGQVELYNAALWRSEESLLFCSTGIETGHLKESQDRENGLHSMVNAVRLSSFLDQNIEFLKLDIEGAEVDVIVEAKQTLKNVKRIWVEYHSLVLRPQRLGELLEVFREEGFRFHLVTETAFSRPLQHLEATYDMDQRLNIWAVRGKQFPRTVEVDVHACESQSATERL